MKPSMSTYQNVGPSRACGISPFWAIFSHFISSLTTKHSTVHVKSMYVFISIVMTGKVLRCVCVEVLAC